MQFTSQDFEGGILKKGIYMNNTIKSIKINVQLCKYSLEDLNVRRAS